MILRKRGRVVDLESITAVDPLKRDGRSRRRLTQKGLIPTALRSRQLSKDMMINFEQQT